MPRPDRPYFDIEEGLAVTDVDWAFIQKLEGGQHLTSYVPVDKKGDAIGRSGVTIASGVDLGQVVDFNAPLKWGVPPELHNKIVPYMGKIKAQALALNQAKPLIVTKEEADLLDSAWLKFNTHSFCSVFKKATTKKPGDYYSVKDMPKEVRTIIASLSWHIGPGWATTFRGKNVADCIYRTDWDALAYRLYTYYSGRGSSVTPQGFINRRQREAKYIALWRGIAIMKPDK